MTPNTILLYLWITALLRHQRNFVLQDMGTNTEITTG